MPLNTPNARAMLFYASLAALLGAFWLCSRVAESKLGRVLVAVRDAESRVRFLGYNTTRIKLFVFVLSAVLAGLAGALYVPQVGIINPGEFSPGNSIEAVVWVAVGGRGTLVGALLGAFSVNALKTWLTSVAPDLWLFALGGLFVAVTLFLPRGLVGLLRRRGP
jgi:urea transport system permease protein